MAEGTINLVGVSGSPRRGATDYIVNYALEYAREHHGAETYYFSVRRKEIRFCIHCDYCIRKQQGCIHKDDLQELYPYLEWAHAWILGTPVYQGQLSAQLKAVLDRCRALVAKDPDVFAYKVGGGLAVGGDRAGGQEPAIQSLIDFYIINQMIPVGGGSFGANLGASLWSKDRKAEGAKEDEEGLAAVRRTVDRVMEVARFAELGSREKE